MLSLEEAIRSNISMDQADFDLIYSRFKSTKYKSGHILLSSGKAARDLYFVNSGFLRVYALEDGVEITLWIVGQGNFITALSSFIFEKPNYWFIECSTDCHLLSISRDDHFELMKTSRPWLEFDAFLLALSFTMLEERTYRHLFKTAKERLIHLHENAPELFLHIPQQHIASLLGISPETLSRLKKQLL